MKKKLIRLASLWLAVLMLAGTAFAAEITVDVYTGTEPLEQWDYVSDRMEEVTLSSETDEFSLNTDAVLDVISESAHGRELRGWNVWENIGSGYLEDAAPTNYEVDEIFTEAQLSDMFVEPAWSEADLRMFVVCRQYGADHNALFDMIVEDDRVELAAEAAAYATPPIYHNFTDNGAFELTSDEVMSAVKLMEGYVVEDWRIWTMVDEELSELPKLDFDAEIEPDSDLLETGSEFFFLVPVVSKLAEITTQPTSVSPTVETDADDKDELIKEYTWYSADEEIEAITPETDESRLVDYDDVNGRFSEDGKKWYAIAGDEMTDYAAINMSEGEKLIVKTGSDDGEATPVMGMAILFYSMDPETGEPDEGFYGQESVLPVDGVLEYTAGKDCTVVLGILYGTMDESAEADENDYITMDILSRSNISVVEGEAAATLENGVFGERYFVEVKVSDEEGRSTILTSDSFVQGYGINHQPTMDEPYVVTNKEEDVVSYAWYQRSAESHIRLEDENEYKLSGGEDGKEYFVDVEFIDETVIRSDYFEWEKPSAPTYRPSGGGGLPATGAGRGNTTPTVTEKEEATKPEDDKGGKLESDKLFDDVPAGIWYAEAAEWMGKKGYMSGTAPRIFSPDLNTTRGMIVTVLWRMAGSPTPSGECPFVDVKPNSYYRDAITWAQENGVVTGHSDTIFKPDDLITREQLAAIIFRNEVRKGMEAVTLEENLAAFEDAGDISEYAITALNWAVGQKVINGVSETKLAPRKTATRAECATMLYRMENK